MAFCASAAPLTPQSIKAAAPEAVNMDFANIDIVPILKTATNSSLTNLEGARRRCDAAIPKE
jgi:hypothetical protein